MTTSQESFAHYPVSLAERRSQSSGRGEDWTPRDALIATLRAVDSGEISPDAMVIVYRTKGDEGKTQTGFFNAAPDVHVVLGMLAVISAQIARWGDD